MARKTKYKTDEQKQDANKRNCKKYYDKNKEILQEKRMQRYWKNKKINIKKLIFLYKNKKLPIAKIVIKMGINYRILLKTLKEKGLYSKNRWYVIPPKTGSEINDGLIFLEEFSKKRKSGHCVDMLWRLKCKCGKEFLCTKSNALNKTTRSCGCYYASLGMYESSKNKLLGTYKTHARNRNLKFKLTKEEFASFLTQNCFYCGKEPKNRSYGGSKDIIFYYNGIDRVNNDLGYDTKNCVSCCKNCNLAKKMLTQKDFFEMVKNIYEKHIQKK